MNFTRQGVIISCLIHTVVLIFLGTLQMKLSPVPGTVQYIRIVFEQEVARFLPSKKVHSTVRKNPQTKTLPLIVKNQLAKREKPASPEKINPAAINPPNPPASSRQEETDQIIGIKAETAASAGTFGTSLAEGNASTAKTMLSGGALGRGSKVGVSQTHPRTAVITGPSGAPTFLHREVPVYPALARRLGKEGRVVLKLLIDQNGKLQRVDVVESAPYGFTEAAIEAARQSTYVPAKQNDVPVSSLAILPIRFRLE